MERHMLSQEKDFKILSGRQALSHHSFSLYDGYLE